MRFIMAALVAGVLVGCGGHGTNYGAPAVRRAFTAADIPLEPAAASTSGVAAVLSLFQKKDGILHTFAAEGLTIDVFGSSAKARRRFDGTGIGRCGGVVIGRDANVVLTAERVDLYARFVKAFTLLRGGRSPHIYVRCRATNMSPGARHVPGTVR